MTDYPKPGPVTPIRAVPVRDSAGLNDDDAEKRRRIIQGLLPYSRDAIRSRDDLLAVSVWIATGDLTDLYEETE